MNQIKIGKFIATRRKEKGWTQSQLADKLLLTDKAISKWETGKSMPDLSLFTLLCDLLDITLNELLLGELISDENCKVKSNQVLLDVLTNWIGVDQRKQTSILTNQKPVLQLHHVTKIYNTENTSTLAVNEVNLTIEKGSFVGIMGSSGCGKSTLLNCIATLDKPTHGSIEINNQDITNLSEEEVAKFRKEHLGFVFQEYNLLDSLTIYENIALALTIKQVSKSSVKSLIDTLANKLELVDILGKFPYEVSGGQRQRCACARAMATQPTLILADEPTGALDSRSAKQLLEMLSLLRQENDSTVLMVTHDAMSASYCDKIYFMQDGQIKKEIVRKQQSKQEFFMRILDTMASNNQGSEYVS